MPARTFIEAIRDTLVDEMRRDETIIVLGEDVGKKGGVFLATDGLWSEFRRQAFRRRTDCSKRVDSRQLKRRTSRPG